MSRATSGSFLFVEMVGAREGADGVGLHVAAGSDAVHEGGETVEGSTGDAEVMLPLFVGELGPGDGLKAGGDALSVPVEVIVLGVAVEVGGGVRPGAGMGRAWGRERG